MKKSVTIIFMLIILCVGANAQNFETETHYMCPGMIVGRAANYGGAYGYTLGTGDNQEYSIFLSPHNLIISNLIRRILFVNLKYATKKKGHLLFLPADEKVYNGTSTNPPILHYQVNLYYIRGKLMGIEVCQGFVSNLYSVKKTK